jgi:hypothetical protein
VQAALVLFIRSCAAERGCAVLLRTASGEVVSVFCVLSTAGCAGGAGVCVVAGSAISGLLTVPLEPAAFAGSEGVDWASA